MEIHFNTCLINPVADQAILSEIIHNAIDMMESNTETCRTSISSNRFEPLVLSVFEAPNLRRGWVFRLETRESDTKEADSREVYRDLVLNVFIYAEDDKSKKMSTAEMRYSVLLQYPDRFDVPGKSEN